MDTLRVSLLPGLLGVVAHNESRGIRDIRVFEIGHVFRYAASKIEPVEGFAEEEHVAMILSGRPDPVHWGRKDRLTDFFDLKGEVQDFLERLSLDKCRFISYSTSDSLVEETIAVESNGGSIGYLGRVRSDVLLEYGIESEVYAAELSTSCFTEKRIAKYRPLPRFPRVRRDVAFIVDVAALAGDIQQSLLLSSGGLLQRAELFDIFEGDPLPEGKKSLAFALEILSEDRTLTDEEIEREVEEAVKAVENKFGATLRRS
jgi:phenylalanyl-tRNA synthetase beta chain